MSELEDMAQRSVEILGEGTYALVERARQNNEEQDSRMLAAQATVVEANKAIIGDQSLALAALVKELAIRKQGYGEARSVRAVADALVLEGISNFVTKLGLEGYITVDRDYANPEVLLQEFKDGRKELGLTQEELGEVLGVSRFVINRMETGNKPVNRDHLANVKQRLRELKDAQFDSTR